MNSNRLSESVSVLIDEALWTENLKRSEILEKTDDAEDNELKIYLKRLYMSIGMKVVRNRRNELEKIMETKEARFE